MEISIYLFIYNVMLKLFKHLNSKDKGIGVVESIGDGIFLFYKVGEKIPPTYLPYRERNHFRVCFLSFFFFQR